MSSPREADDQERRREAADWVVRWDRGLAASEQDEFFEWLARDPRHGEWLAQARETWGRFDQLAEPSLAGRPSAPARARPRRLAAWLAAPLAAAAALALVYFDEHDATAPAGASAGADLPAPGFEHRVLADGTIMELKAGTIAHVTYTATERQVRLDRGEAHFVVVRNAERPFRVEAGGVGVRAVGTAFAVKFEGAEVDVIVTEGRVRVEPPGPAVGPEVAAGQRVVVSPGAAADRLQVESLAPSELAAALDWRPQLLEFGATPLAQVAEAFNRHNRLQIVIGDPQLAALPIVASFRSDNPEAFIRLLETSADVRVERPDRHTVVVHRK